MGLGSSRYHPISKWDTDIVATSTSGAVFVNLPSHQADEVTILVLAAGVGLDIIGPGSLSRAGQTQFVQVDAPSGLTIALTGDSKEVLVRRSDKSNTPYTVRFIWRKYGR